MFESFRRRPAEVLDHWYTLVPGFHTPATEFYAAVERELKARQVPNLDPLQVEFHEAGPISAKRTYLRLIRERLAFDVCAAPFGTAYFFSVRFVEIPVHISLLSLAGVFFALLFLLYLSVKTLGLLLGPPALVFLLVAAVFTLRNATSLGLHDLDTALLRTPVIGPLYEGLIRRDTYYRQDTRLMYYQVVSEVVKQQVDNLTAANGIKLLRSFQKGEMSESYREQSHAPVPTEPPVIA